MSLSFIRMNQNFTSVKQMIFDEVEVKMNVVRLLINQKLNFFYLIEILFFVKSSLKMKDFGKEPVSKNPATSMHIVAQTKYMFTAIVYQQCKLLHQTKISLRRSCKSCQNSRHRKFLKVKTQTKSETLQPRYLSKVIYFQDDTFQR